jgi:hypothetical protein
LAFPFEETFPFAACETAFKSRETMKSLEKRSDAAGGRVELIFKFGFKTFVCE